MHIATSAQRRLVRLALAAGAATALVAGVPAAALAQAAPAPVQAPAAPGAGLLDPAALADTLGLNLDALLIVPEGAQLAQDEVGRILAPLGADISGTMLADSLVLPNG